MTASEAYWSCIDEWKVPASVIVEDLEGNRGLATQRFNVLNNSRAFEMVFSDNETDRAIAAIHAIDHVRRSIIRSEDLQLPSEISHT